MSPRKRPDFVTVPDDRVPYAERLESEFESQGYKVRREPEELSFPYTPTITCRRGSTMLIVELYDEILESQIDEWARYAKSTSKDTRIIIALPAPHRLSHSQDQWLRARGIGLWRVSTSSAQETIAPQDLSLSLALPELGKQHSRLRPILGPFYDQFKRGEWREGFQHACDVLEVQARTHLIKGVKSGRVTFVDNKGRSKTYTKKQIERRTMGQLADLFDQIQTPNRTDTTVGKILHAINDDRIKQTHHKGKATTESALRKNVGQNMWGILQALKALLGIK